MKKANLTAILAIAILNLTDINEGVICEIEAAKIKNEVERATAQYKEGIITKKDFEEIIFKNQERLEDVLIEVV
jgi:hypothetical protein